jgi:hypothetical protein
MKLELWLVPYLAATNPSAARIVAWLFVLSIVSMIAMFIASWLVARRPVVISPSLRVHLSEARRHFRRSRYILAGFWVLGPIFFIWTALTGKLNRELLDVLLVYLGVILTPAYIIVRTMESTIKAMLSGTENSSR